MRCALVAGVWLLAASAAAFAQQSTWFDLTVPGSLERILGPEVRAPAGAAPAARPDRRLPRRQFGSREPDRHGHLSRLSGRPAATAHALGRGDPRGGGGQPARRGGEPRRPTSNAVPARAVRSGSGSRRVGLAGCPGPGRASAGRLRRGRRLGFGRRRAAPERGRGAAVGCPVLRGIAAAVAARLAGGRLQRCGRERGGGGNAGGRDGGRPDRAAADGRPRRAVVSGAGGARRRHAGLAAATTAAVVPPG